MGNRKNKNRLVRRRKFTGNVHTHGKSNRSQVSKLSTVSLNESLCMLRNKVLDENFFLIINFNVLKNVIDLCGSCPECREKVMLDCFMREKMGLSQKLSVFCTSCDWKKQLFSSPQVVDGKKGNNRHEVNLRTVMAFREIGKGYASIVQFCSVMNMPPPFNKKVYNRINELLHEAYQSVATESMQRNAKEIKDIVGPCSSNNNVYDCDISLDGTWQKRGHASLNGVVSAVSKDTKKVIDFQVMSKFCRACEIHQRQKKTDPIAYSIWKNSHSCKINHKGSAGAMEAMGAIEIFRSSLQRYSLRYAHYIGDGDSSSYGKVVESKPYNDEMIPVKWECLGHVQKRMGTRLRDYRKDNKKQVLSDGKKLSGKGRLTDKVINSLQNFYGMALRNNKQLYPMKKAVGAVLWHCTDLPPQQRHVFCPRSEDSWCKWQVDQIKSTNTFSGKIKIPVAIKQAIQPIFQDLSADSLLSKCLHDFTQNPNEAFNQIVWNKCPKSVFVSRNVLELAVYSAVINFNEGFSGIKRVFDKLGVQCGQFFEIGGVKKDIARASNTLLKSSEKGKRQRKKLRAIRKGFQDKENQEEEGPSYKPGGF